MRVLIADDDSALRHGLYVHLLRWGYDPAPCADGTEARVVLHGPQPPPLALLDWNMPGVNGLELCREIRSLPDLASMYVVLLTAHSAREEMVTGLDCGADDYMTKPVDWELLRARLQIGARIVTLQQSLASRVRELQKALETVKELSGLLPICSYCKTHPRRPELLAAARELRQRAHQRPVQPRHLPDLLRDGEARDGAVGSLK